jgi:hypothetical protein
VPIVLQRFMGGLVVFLIKNASPVMLCMVVPRRLH